MDTSEAITQLREAVEKLTWRTSGIPDARTLVQLIDVVGAGGDVTAVPALFSMLAYPEHAVEVAVYRAMRQIIGRADARHVRLLDRILRDVTFVKRPGGWYEPGLADVSEAASLSDGEGMLAVLACVRDGWVREAAVRALGERETAVALPFVLVRLNDWVPQVRRAAGDVARARLRPQDAPAWVRSLPLLHILAGQRREDHSELCASAMSLLRGPQAADALWDALGGADAWTRRLAFDVALESTGIGAGELLVRGLASSDPVLRQRAARAGRERLGGGALEQHLERLNRDRFMPVRREALLGVVQRFPERADEALRAALLDAHGAMRDTARFHLRRRGETDFASIYRAAVGTLSGASLAAALEGLGEVGSTGGGDAEAAAGFVDHAYARVRRAAVRVLARLGGDEYRDTVVRTLYDARPEVSRAAAAALADRFTLPPDRLWQLFEKAPHAHVRRYLLPAMARGNRVEALTLLFRATAAAGDAVAARVRMMLRRWGTYWPNVSGERLRELSAAFAAAKDRLDPAFVASFDQYLDHAERYWKLQ